jgi:hypothetical protein
MDSMDSTADDTVDSTANSTANSTADNSANSEPELEPNSMPDPEGQEYLDRSKLDFDPADGHYSGTAVDGTTEIPGPHPTNPDAEKPDAG